MKDLNSINFSNENRSKVEKFLNSKNIMFSNIIFNQDYKNLIDFIYGNNLYEINYQMIELFIDLYKVNEIDLEKLKTSNFTTIQKSGCKKLINYINDDIYTYVDCIFLELKDNIEEDENSIVTLLNNEDLSNEICFLIIEKSPTVISDLLKIKDKTLWSKLFEYNRLTVSWKNFFEYYKDEKVIDETLVKYLNNETVFRTLSQMDMKEIDRNLKLSFSENIILSGIDHESFKDIAKQFPFCYSMDELIEVNEIRIKILIDNDLITFDKDNFESLNELYSSLTFLFIIKNKQEFLTIYPELELNNLIIKDIIKSSEAEFNKEEKIKIIENIEDFILTSDKQLLKDLCIFLYDKYKININELVLNGLLSSDVEDLYKVSLFNIYYNKSLSTNILNMRIKSLGEPYNSALGRKHLKLIDSSFNRLFCQNLNKRYVGEISEKNGMISVIPKTIKR